MASGPSWGTDPRTTPVSVRPSAPGSPRRELALMAGAVVVILGAVTATVALGVHATAGWLDQSHYHWPTVAKMVRELPSVDVVNVMTATGPLYHLSLAVPARILGLPEGGVEVLAAAYGCVLAVLVILAGRGMPAVPRLAASAVVLLSPYYWESTLWMQTDVAAMTFAFAALLVLLGPRPPHAGRALAVGLLVAGAVGVRQTFGWLIVVAALGLWLSNAGRPLRTRVADVALGTVPGAAVLLALVVAWKGLLPPPLARLNATHHSPAGLTYMVALAACYLTPLVLALGRDVWGRRQDWPIAAGAGLVAALPGIVFPSSELAGRELPRSGGWLWAVVARTPAPGDRSVLLVGLAFVGGAAFALLLLRIARGGSPQVAWVLGTALVTAAVFASAGAQMYQKYYETPLVLIVFLVIREAFRGRPPHRRAWALGPTLLQGGAAVALVLVPFVLAA